MSCSRGVQVEDRKLTPQIPNEGGLSMRTLRFIFTTNLGIRFNEPQTAGTYIELQASDRFPLFEQRSQYSGNGCPCGKPYYTDKRAVSIHEAEEVLNGDFKTSYAVTFRLAMSPCPHMIIVFGEIVGISRQHPRWIMKLESIKGTSGWIFGYSVQQNLSNTFL